MLGLGAKDDFSLNLKANETEYQRYILDYLPVQEQYSYVFGFVWKHFRENGYDSWIISRNYLNNTQNKYQNNIPADSNRILDYLSGEGEMKARYERTILGEKGFRADFGAGMEYGHYRNSTYRRIYLAGQPDNELSYKTNLKIGKFSAYGQLSRSFMGSRLTLSFGCEPMPPHIHLKC